VHVAEFGDNPGKKAAGRTGLVDALLEQLHREVPAPVEGMVVTEDVAGILPVL
jgi:hypothetical protein